LQHRIESEIFYDPQYFSDFAGFLPVLKIANETNIGSGNQSKLSLVHPQAFPVPPDEITECLVVMILFRSGKYSQKDRLLRKFFPNGKILYQQSTTADRRSSPPKKTRLHPC